MEVSPQKRYLLFASILSDDAEVSTCARNLSTARFTSACINMSYRLSNGAAGRVSLTSTLKGGSRTSRIGGVVGSSANSFADK